MCESVSHIEYRFEICENPKQSDEKNVGTPDRSSGGGMQEVLLKEFRYNTLYGRHAGSCWPCAEEQHHTNTNMKSTDAAGATFIFDNDEHEVRSRDEQHEKRGQTKHATPLYSGSSRCPRSSWKFRCTTAPPHHHDADHPQARERERERERESKLFEWLLVAPHLMIERQTAC